MAAEVNITISMPQSQRTATVVGIRNRKERTQRNAHIKLHSASSHLLQFARIFNKHLLTDHTKARVASLS